MLGASDFPREDTRPLPTPPELPETVPGHYRNALLDLFAIRFSDTRFFICKTWYSRSVSGIDVRTGLFVLVSAERLSEAQECVHVVKNISQALADEYADQSIGDAEFNEIKRILNQRVTILSEIAAKTILDDIGVPVGGPHGDSIIVIPFNETTGFSEEHVTLFSRIIPVGTGAR